MYIHKIVMDNKDLKALLYCIVGFIVLSSSVPTLRYAAFVFFGYALYICVSKIKKLVEEQGGK